VKVKFRDGTNNEDGHVKIVRSTLKMYVGGTSNYNTATSKFYQPIFSNHLKLKIKVYIIRSKLKY